MARDPRSDLDGARPFPPNEKTCNSRRVAGDKTVFRIAAAELLQHPLPLGAKRGGDLLHAARRRVGRDDGRAPGVAGAPMDRERDGRVDRCCGLR